VLTDSLTPPFPFLSSPIASDRLRQMEKPNAKKIWFDIGITAASFAICTGICFLLDYFSVNNLNFLIIYILGVMFTAVFTDGFVYSTLLSILSVLGFNFFFTAPRYTFAVSDSSYLVTFLLMLAVGLAVSSITFQLKKRMAQVSSLKIEKAILQSDAEKEQAKTTLLQSVSHDLRTPLTTIKNGAQTLQDNPLLPLEERQEILSDITHKSDWTIKLIENLLSLTRIDSSSLTVKKREEALEEVIPQAVRTIQSDLGDRHIHYQMPEEFVLVPMDATLISQVLVNILSNAIKHTAADGNIWIEVRKTSSQALFRISNDGEPLREDETAEIFDMYYQKTDRSNENLAGLGLAICKLIIVAHGGVIDAKNEAGRVVFSFTLPLQEKINE
jgi:two-component system, OmpR family, sensor histidine kinase KdpD